MAVALLLMALNLSMSWPEPSGAVSSPVANNMPVWFPTKLNLSPEVGIYIVEDP